MKVIFLLLLKTSFVMMDNIEDLKIIDSLLKNYDRRATPTNRMGKLKFSFLFASVVAFKCTKKLYSVLKSFTTLFLCFFYQGLFFRLLNLWIKVKVLYTFVKTL